MNVFTKNKSSKKIYFYEKSCGENTFTRHRTRAQKRSLHNDRTSVPIGRYVATERPFRSVARSLRSDQASVPFGRYVATELEPKLDHHVATERPFRSMLSSVRSTFRPSSSETSIRH
ncbi:hypothetical protein F2Q69_00034478 [Brassica cretica]|uniref:Uncharacterized protein n=1 Tax=Brassica cretica TaxID=69181 RepID=A0A8S9SCB6_BRACR|nr:hypothetical protein F2Q69_00034478 [Brassica cretica]